jgi:molybdopterin-containing oxidoreductase family membrane subunit
MCLAFVTVDLGRPDRFWHLIPGVGKFNFPGSMLSWDVIVLNGYLLLNLHICGYLLYCRYTGRHPSTWFYIPFVFVAIVWAVSIHTVTAFLYVGLGGRPFWNSSIVGPRFLASAFTAGPALIILALQIIRRVTDYRISDQALLTQLMDENARLPKPRDSRDVMIEAMIDTPPSTTVSTTRFRTV